MSKLGFAMDISSLSNEHRSEQTEAVSAQESIQSSLTARSEEGPEAVMRFLLALPRKEFRALLETGASHESLSPEKRKLIDRQINLAYEQRRAMEVSDHQHRSEESHVQWRQQQKDLEDRLRANAKPAPDLPSESNIDQFMQEVPRETIFQYARRMMRLKFGW